MSAYPSDLELALLAAGGLCELGQWEEAWEHLEEMLPEERADPAVFTLRLRILVGLERWESAAVLAESMKEKGDRSPETWLQGADSIRHARFAEAARAFVEQAEAFLSGLATYHYKVARFACLVGDMTACKERLARCFALDPGLRMQALDEEDLYPFW